MAVTKLWHIEGRVKDLIDYVENPDKTVPSQGLGDFFNVFSYAANPAKTEDGRFVIAINCLRETALQQMILTKKRFGKDDGYIAWHGYMSFKPGEITPAECHCLGIQLAREMWGERFEIIVTTHLDKEHLHCHFAFNSVSFKDGGKYNYSNAERRRMMDICDRLCSERGLSVVNRPHKAPSRPVHVDEKAGLPTLYNVYRKDVEEAMYGSQSRRMMEKYLRRLGYDTDFTGQDWMIRLHPYEHFTKLKTLNEEWTAENIPYLIGREARFGNTRPIVSRNYDIPQNILYIFKPHEHTTHIYRLYLYYCYELGILPKGTDYRPTSPYLRQELRKLDAITAETDYMARNHIETYDDLIADRSQCQKKLDALTAQRTRLQNRIRRAAPEEKLILRAKKAQVTEQITALRKRVKCTYGIENRSVLIQENLDRVYDNERRAALEKKARNYER